MLRRDRLIRMQFNQVVDACLFALSFLLAYALRSNPLFIRLLGLNEVAPFDQYVWLYLILIPAAPMILELQGFYTRPLLCTRLNTAWLLFKSCALVSLALVLCLFLGRKEMARSVIFWFGATSFCLVFLKEELVMVFLKTKLAQGQIRRRFVLVGDSGETERVRKELKEKSAEIVDIIAEVDLSQTTVQRLVELLHEHSVNGVIVSAKRALFDEVEQAIRACELEGVEVWLMADFFKTQICRTSLDDFYGQPILVFRTVPESSWQGLAKQVLDAVGAALLLTLLSPVLLAAALGVKMTSPGPILFRQQRSGVNGRPFRLYKFRTMVTNAEQLKHELAAMNEMSGPVFKVTNDPRITAFGRLLRKFSIDELPQLYNVLRGEMSLVGPRPLPVDEVKRFNDLAHRRRLSVKPGLTCLWQISGRNNVKDFKDWVRLDLEYIDNWSLWLDFKILCRTVPVVLTGAGAR